MTPTPTPNMWEMVHQTNVLLHHFYKEEVPSLFSHLQLISAQANDLGFATKALLTLSTINTILLGIICVYAIVSLWNKSERQRD